MQWRRLEPLLPLEKPWTGRPSEDHRRVLNGMLWIDRTGGALARPARAVATGARRDGAVEDAENVEALGRSQGGFSTKLHLRAEGSGKPARSQSDWRGITAVLTAGERHEQTALEALLDQGAVRRPGRGRPRLRPHRLAGDKG